MFLYMYMKGAVLCILMLHLSLNMNSKEVSHKALYCRSKQMYLNQLLFLHSIYLSIHLRMYHLYNMFQRLNEHCYNKIQWFNEHRYNKIQ